MPSPPPIRQQAIDLFRSIPAGEEMHPREVARRLGRAAPPVVRELARLEVSGLLRSRRVGPLRRYRLATSETRPVGHDERLLALHQRVSDKLRQAPERVLEKARANLRRWAEIDPGGNEYWIDSWEGILRRPPAEIAMVLTEDTPEMRQMRQASPFAGVLSEAERLAVIRGRGTSI